MTKHLHIATTNAGKLAEFRQVLGPLGFQVEGVLGLDDFNVVEDGETFEANALKKAQALMLRCGQPAVADDSGLCVDALGGAPGIHSARYAGVQGDEQDAANRLKLLQALKGVETAQRGAHFVCVLAYCVPGKAPRFYRGELHGTIAYEERGGYGFGYDSIFYLPHLGKTSAQLRPDEKNAISHRGKALAQLVRDLAN